MKHAFSFLIAIIATLSTQICHAGPIDSDQALRNAQAFLQKKGINIQAKGIRRAPSVKANQDQAPYYVFNVGDEGGFVIASGDDRAYPVLAYSDIGSFHTDSLPENVQYMLDFYKAQIKALKETDTTVAKPRRSPVKVVEPLLTTKWGQDYPYNLSCPTNQKGRRCITGCVATALAQVMYYHRKHSTRQVIKDIPGYTDYNDNDGSMTVDTVPKGSVIDWDKMEEFEYSDNYTEEQAKAVAIVVWQNRCLMGRWHHFHQAPAHIPLLTILITMMMPGWNNVSTIPMQNGKAWCMKNSLKATLSLMQVEVMPMLLTVVTRTAMYTSIGDGKEKKMAIFYCLPVDMTRNYTVILNINGLFSVPDPMAVIPALPPKVLH